MKIKDLERGRGLIFQKREIAFNIKTFEDKPEGEELYIGFRSQNKSMVGFSLSLGVDYLTIPYTEPMRELFVGVWKARILEIETELKEMGIEEEED